MARTLIPTTVLPKNGSLAAVSWVAADSTNNHYYVDAGDTILLARNATASAKTVTVVSVADPDLGRTGDKSIVVPATDAESGNGIGLFGLPTGQAWRQAGTPNINVNVSASDPIFQLAAIQVTRR